MIRFQNGLGGGVFCLVIVMVKTFECQSKAHQLSLETVSFSTRSLSKTQVGILEIWLMLGMDKTTDCA